MCIHQECTDLDTPHENCLCSANYYGVRCIMRECIDLDTPHENCLCSDQFDDSGVTCTQRDCTTDTDTPYTGCIM